MMAKPDIQLSYITASGTAYRDKGKLGLESKGPVVGTALLAQNHANDGAADTGGVLVGGLYHTDGAVKIRRT